jgi:hypothetical protein
MRDIFKQFLSSNVVSEKNRDFFLTIGHKLFKNTILDVLISFYILFRLIFVLNLSFPYISCNFDGLVKSPVSPPLVGGD